MITKTGTTWWRIDVGSTKGIFSQYVALLKIINGLKRPARQNHSDWLPPKALKHRRHILGNINRFFYATFWFKPVSGKITWIPSTFSGDAALAWIETGNYIMSSIPGRLIGKQSPKGEQSTLTLSLAMLFFLISKQLGKQSNSLFVALMKLLFRLVIDYLGGSAVSYFLKIWGIESPFLFHRTFCRTVSIRSLTLALASYQMMQSVK